MLLFLLAIWVSPARADTVWHAAESRSELSIFVSALRAAGLDGLVQEADEITMFAPTNDVLERMFGDQIGGPADHNALVKLTARHLVLELISGRETEGQFLDTLTVSGTRIGILNAGSMGMFVGTTVVLLRDVEASNGVLHVINGVLPSE